jgi:hypothetical protein
MIICETDVLDNEKEREVKKIIFVLREKNAKEFLSIVNL